MFCTVTAIFPCVFHVCFRVLFAFVRSLGIFDCAVAGAPYCYNARRVFPMIFPIVQSKALERDS